jgi:hypothetical protein
MIRGCRLVPFETDYWPDITVAGNSQVHMEFGSEPLQIGSREGFPGRRLNPVAPGQQGVPLHQEWLPPKSSAQISVTKAVGS